MRLVLSVVVIAAGLAAVPAAASQNNGANGQGAEPARERRVCRPVASTGSIMPARRQCKTQAEWDDADRTAQRNLERRPGATPPSDGQ